MKATTTISQTAYRISVKADTPREALQYVRSILPVTAARSVNLTATRTGAHTFEVYA